LASFARAFELNRIAVTTAQATSVVTSSGLKMSYQLLELLKINRLEVRGGVRLNAIVLV
jgi:hypothetical protein